MNNVAVWDVRSRGVGGPSWRHWGKAAKWALSHGGDTHTYRYEIHLADGPFARIFRYAVNEDGRRFLDPFTREAATAEPLTVALDELPPAELRVRAI